MSRSRIVYTHIVQNLGFHEWLDHFENFIEKVNGIEDMNRSKFARHSVLKVREELVDRLEIHPGQVHEADVGHVE